MEDKAQDQRHGRDPLGHEDWGSGQAAEPGGGRRRDGVCTTLLFTLRVSSPLLISNVHKAYHLLFAIQTFALILISDGYVLFVTILNVCLPIEDELSWLMVELYGISVQRYS